MSLIAFASAKGSPGVSVSAAGLVRWWPGPVVLADCDPVGGDVALRYRDPEGEPLDIDRGLVSLGAAVRSGGEALLADHVQETRSGMSTLIGVSSSGQVIGLGPAWQHIALTMRRTRDVDVLADVGRLTPGSPAMPLVTEADAVVFVTGPTLEEIAHLRQLLSSLKDTLRLGHVDAARVGVAMVTRASDTRGLADLDRLLASVGLPVTPLGIIAVDPKGADALRTESDRNLRRSELMRSLYDLVPRVRDLARLTGRVGEDV